jgi:hypothetical protein
MSSRTGKWKPDEEVVTPAVPAIIEPQDSINARVTALQREVTDAGDKLKRLYRLVEDGMTEMDDVLKDRLNSLKADRSWPAGTGPLRVRR